MLRSKIKPGELDVRLAIEQNTETVNASTNERESSWSLLTSVWAKRIVKGGKEGFEADQQVATRTETFLIRYSSDVSSIDETYRVYESGTTDYFYVTTIEKQKREGYIMLEAEYKDG